MNDATLPQRREAHLKDYLRILAKHGVLIVAVFLTVTTAGAVWTARKTPIYQATATVLIDPEPPKFINIQDVTPIGATSGDYYQTQYEIMRSRAVVERVVQNLNLRQRMPSIANSTDPSGAIQGAITIEPKRGTRIVYIRFESDHPALAADVANGIAVAYTRYNLDLKLRGAQDALGWLTEQMAQLKSRVQDSANALQSYRAKSGIMGLQEQRQITAQKIIDFNKAYLEAQAQRLSVESKLSQLTQISRDRSAADSMFTVAQNPLIEKLKAESSELELQKSKLLKVYRDKHPEVLKIDAQIQHIAQRIAAEIQTMLRSLQTEHKVAKAREESMLHNVNSLRREGQELNEKEIQYVTLQRESESNQQLYDTVMKRLKETGMAGGLETNNIRVMEEAKVPGSPIRPRKSTNIMLSALLGAVLGLGLAIGLEYFDTTVKNADDVERHLGLPVIAIIPAFSVKR